MLFRSPGSCQDRTLAEDGLEGKHSKCDFKIGKCKCVEGWSGEQCMIPCPENCDTELGVLCDSDLPSSDPYGFSPEGRCACEAGSWGFDCSLACPGGRKNPCNGHTDHTTTWKDEEPKKTCLGDGTCECWDSAPRGPWFGDRCDITCGDPRMESPEDDPDYTRCGRVGETFAECRYDEALEAAECKCARNYYGPKCDQRCPINEDTELACSLRGECMEVDGKASCLCDLGFYGDICEFIAFEGSGAALAFTGVPEAQAEYPLAPPQLSASAEQGFTIMFWFQAHELPTATNGPSLVRWRHGDVRLTKDGKVELCGQSAPQNCIQSKNTIKVGTTEAEWYWVAASMQNTAAGTGNMKIYLMEKDAADIGVPAENGEALTTLTGDKLLVGTNGFSGLIDQIYVINRPATAQDLVDYREGVVAWSTPGVLFMALCDTGRGHHVYAEYPFIAGPKHESVRWSRSHAPLKWATLNSEVAPPLKIGDPARPALRAYELNYDGKRASKGFISFRALSPMNAGKKRQELMECNISAFLVDPLAPLDLVDNNNELLDDDTIRANDKRPRIPIFENRKVSGNKLSAMEDPIALPRQVLSALRTGRIELEWKMLPNQPGCNNMAKPLIIENSFITLHTEQVDGIAQTTGIGHMSVQPKQPLKGSWSIEAWVYNEPVRTGNLADSSLFMLYKKSVTVVDLVNEKPQLALFLQSQTNRGASVRYASGAATVTGYDIQNLRDEWFHVQLTMTQSGSQCTPAIYVDGVKQGNGVAGNCGDGTVPNWNSNLWELRIGSGFQGRFNDFMVWNQVQSAGNTMHVLKNFKQSTVHLGFSFDDTTQMDTKAAQFMMTDDSGKGNDLKIVKGIYRGQIFGAEHRWKSCPGIDEILHPERVCGNTQVQERGVCFIEDEENEGVLTTTYKCLCNEGFAGRACQKQCLGQVKIGNEYVTCSGHGRCLTVDSGDEVVCECDEGYAGEGCEFMCPGFDATIPGAKACSGYGECALNAAGTAAKCNCNQQSNRYGLACEYEQNALPLIGCDECVNNEVCNDGICDCAHPLYRVGDYCVEASSADRKSVV